MAAAPLPTEQARLGRYLQVAKQRLGEKAYAQLWTDVQLVSLDDMLKLARSLLHTLGEAAPLSTPPERGDALSAREREVAILVTRGYSNREIAEQLVITRKTAEAHVHHVLNKLGLENRVQIATWGLRHGIVPAMPVPAA